jgi:methionyl-tRNA synthetase
MITIDDFHNIEIRIGTILAVEKVPDTDKLLKLSVDFGVQQFTASTDGALSDTTVQPQREIRTIVSGIALFFEDPQTLVGKQCPFVYNLAPRMLRGIESNGMILAAGDGDSFAVLHPDRPVAPGSKIK